MLIIALVFSTAIQWTYRVRCFLEDIVANSQADNMSCAHDTCRESCRFHSTTSSSG